MIKHVAAAVSGALFSLGLVWGGAVRPTVVLHAFTLGDWDPSLYLMFIGGLITHVPLSTMAYRRRRSLSGAPLVRTQGVVDAKLVTGAVVFGVGWGIGGLCPGPLLAGVLTLSPTLLVFAAAYAAGVLLGARLERTSPTVAASPTRGTVPQSVRQL